MGYSPRRSLLPAITGMIGPGGSVVAKNGKALALPETLTDEDFQARLTELAIESNRDDDKARDLLAFCRAHPEAWTHFGTLQGEVVDHWLQLLAPGNAGDRQKAAWKREHIHAQLKERRKALRAEGDSPLE